jgi:hypothetical protein
MKISSGGIYTEARGLRDAMVNCVHIYMVRPLAQWSFSEQRYLAAIGRRIRSGSGWNCLYFNTVTIGDRAFPVAAEYHM